MARLIVLLCLALSVTLPARAGQILRIASPDYWCPFSCTAGAAQEGFTVDILRAIFVPLGYQVEFRNTNYARALQDVRTGLSDVIPSVLKGEAPDFVFPALPISRNRFCVYSRTDSQWLYRQPEDLQHLNLGLIQGYNYGADLSAWFAAHPKQVVRLAGDNILQRLAAMLDLQRIDGFIEDESMVSFLQAQQPQRPLRQAGCSNAIYGFMGISAGNPQASLLSQQFDQGLRRLRQSGELKQILARYGLLDWHHD